jgi:RES domain-containing protein
VVYASEHLAMAAMEKLVHLKPGLGGQVRYVCFRIYFGDVAVETVDVKTLPPAWDAKPVRSETQELGAEWIASRRTAILRVPSAIIPSECNFVLNPAHADFGHIRIEPPEPFGFDPRLLVGDSSK